MAYRLVRKLPDELLKKTSREVKKIDKRLLDLLDDMVETMYKNEGIGLAGPQVGILRRIFTADIGDGKVYKVINPEILERRGENIAIEGCLSIPNSNGTVIRSKWVKMKYMDIEGNEQIIETDGLLAKCFQHEIDHLNGILINSKYTEQVYSDNFKEIENKVFEMNEKFDEEYEKEYGKKEDIQAK